MHKLDTLSTWTRVFDAVDGPRPVIGEVEAQSRHSPASSRIKSLAMVSGGDPPTWVALVPNAVRTHHAVDDCPAAGAPLRFACVPHNKFSHLKPPSLLDS